MTPESRSSWRLGHESIADWTFKLSLSPFHKLTCLEVGGHGLVVLVLHGERVSIGEPGGSEHPIELRGFAEVAPRKLLLPDEVIVRADGKPRHAPLGVKLYELLSQVEKL